MRSVISGVLLPGLILLGQVPRNDEGAFKKLTSTLKNLRHVGADSSALSHQLADVMILLGEKGHPSRLIIQSFADNFTGALIGRNLTNAQVVTLHLRYAYPLLAA